MLKAGKFWKLFNGSFPERVLAMTVLSLPFSLMRRRTLIQEWGWYSGILAAIASSLVVATFYSAFSMVVLGGLLKKITNRRSPEDTNSES